MTSARLMRHCNAERRSQRIGLTGNGGRRPERSGVASRARDLVSGKRQNNQMFLAFMAGRRGEAPEGASQGTESLAATRGTERPACRRSQCPRRSPRRPQVPTAPRPSNTPSSAPSNSGANDAGRCSDARRDGGRPTTQTPADCGFARLGATMCDTDAGVAQLVERQPSKLNVVGSSPITRSFLSRTMILT